MKILFISGPNINLMGQREVVHYGTVTYDEMVSRISDLLSEKGVSSEFYQSNHEGALVEKIQNAGRDIDGLIVNPAAFTHTSIAIRDALIASEIPAVEVHMSNVYSREEFRKHSMIEDVVTGKICGFGWYSYYLGALSLMELKRGK